MREGLRTGFTLPRVVLEGYDAPSAPTSWTTPSRACSTTRSARSRRRARGATAARLRAPAARRSGRASSRLSRLPRLHDRRIPPEERGRRSGASDLPQGREYYAHRVQRFTTLDVTPEEVHQIGLDEVARIRRGDADGDQASRLPGRLRRLPPVPAHRPALLREDAGGAAPASVLHRQEDGRQAAVACSAGCRACPTAWSRCPRTSPRSTPAAATSRGAGGRHARGHVLGQHVRAESRPLYMLEALTLHEAVPGHHLQIALQQELTGLPAFRRLPASAHSSRAGASTPSASAWRPASTRTRTATSAG